MLFDEDVRIAQFIADAHLQPDLVKAGIEGEFDALLFHGTGLGHLPIADPQEDSQENTILRLMLEDYCANDGVVVVVAQTIHGPMNMNVYAKGREQQEMGIIGHGSLCPPSSALVKLHHLLSRGGGRETVAAGWIEDICGENPNDSME
jgi:L-asparaginase/Glu-tRNA(Gln) amidotransferase subunit D